mmetsp:Transcript_81244/g.173887  ORF Transcript_81244/g.173887 Transcript_81244/m.173887 type:complete len:220 (-) Transcript_81244:226-885(-)
MVTPWPSAIFLPRPLATWRPTLVQATQRWLFGVLRIPLRWSQRRPRRRGYSHLQWQPLTCSRSPICWRIRLRRRDRKRLRPRWPSLLVPASLLPWLSALCWETCMMSSSPYSRASASRPPTLQRALYTISPAMAPAHSRRSSWWPRSLVLRALAPASVLALASLHEVEHAQQTRSCASNWPRPRTWRHSVVAPMPPLQALWIPPAPQGRRSRPHRPCRR